MPIWKHIRAVLLLPFIVTIVIPIVILHWTRQFADGWLLRPGALPFPALGTLYVAIGLSLLVRTIIQFAREGGGTLAPWDPTGRLVVTGIYRYVRNPMISGVLFILLGEATFFGSKPLLVWFLVFLAINAVYIPLFEERGLEARFGEAYREYKRSVPRWIPRVKPWDRDRG